MKDTLFYWETELQTNVANMISAADNDECGTAETGQSWLGNFLRYNSSTPSIDIDTESSFMANLRV